MSASLNSRNIRRPRRAGQPHARATRCLRDLWLVGPNIERDLQSLGGSDGGAARASPRRAPLPATRTTTGKSRTHACWTRSGSGSAGADHLGDGMCVQRGRNDGLRVRGQSESRQPTSELLNEFLSPSGLPRDRSRAAAVSIAITLDLGDLAGSSPARRRRVPALNDVSNIPDPHCSIAGCGKGVFAVRAKCR